MFRRRLTAWIATVALVTLLGHLHLHDESWRYSPEYYEPNASTHLVDPCPICEVLCSLNGTPAVVVTVPPPVDTLLHVGLDAKSVHEVLHSRTHDPRAPPHSPSIPYL